MDKEIHISVDVETAGPVAPTYSLLSIGACLCDEPDQTFYSELKPINDNRDPEAMQVNGLDFEHLKRFAPEPGHALRRFSEWARTVSSGHTIVMTGLSIAFDHSFLNYYFHAFGVADPFHRSPLCVKALYTGRTGSSWDDTRSSRMDRVLRPRLIGDHHPVRDAQYQAELYRLIRDLPAA